MRLPLASDIKSRDGTLDKDAKLVNCFVDVDGENSFVVKRPGYFKSVDVADGAGLGIVSWEGKNYSAAGNSIYQTDYASIPASGQTQEPTAELQHPGWEIQGGDNYFIFGQYLYARIFPYGISRSKPGFSGWEALTMPIGTSINMTPIEKNGVLYSVGYLGQHGQCSMISSNAADWSLLLPDGTVQNNHSISLLTRSFFDGTRFVGLARNIDGLQPGIYVSGDAISWTLVNDSNIPNRIFTHKGRYYSYYQQSYVPGTYGSINASDDLVNWSTYFLTSDHHIERLYSDVFSDGDNLILISANNYTDGRLFVFELRLIDIESNSISKLLDTYSNNSQYFNGIYGVGLINGEFVVCIDDSLLSIHIDPGSGSFITPSHSYPITTITPGQQLSWVGTSPGTSVKRLFIKNETQAWTLIPGDPGTLEPVTDPDYPATTVPGAVYLDGYFFVMDSNGTVYNCDLENPTSWNSLDYITAEAEWDKGVAIAKHQNYVVALKDWTTELFYDAANPEGSPLAKLSNATIQIGCAQGYSAVQFHGGLVFMSKTREKGRSIHFFAANSIDPQEIATPAVQRILNKSDLTTVSAWGGKVAGRVLYVLNLVTADITLVYDFTTQAWAQWASAGENGAQGHFVCGFYATDGNRDFVQHEATGDIYTLAMDTYQDDGAAIDVLIRTGRIDAGNMDRKTMRALTVVGDQADTSVTVQYSDDDYQTFSSARTVSMSDSPARLLRLGMFRRRSFDIRHVDNTPLRLVAIDAEMEQAR